jgi:putative ABC transport system ATP-binding protein
MLVLRHLTKAYQTRAGEVKALDDVSLQIDKGDFVVVCGPSGSGKTTLLMTVAAMLRPTEGDVHFDERDVYAMTVRDRARFRAENIGFVFQMFHLVPYLSVVDNVLLARGATPKNGRKARALELLGQLGLKHRVAHRPAELSAGEKQRAAIARAMLNRPKLILADEPTGNLDPDNAQSVLRYLADFQRDGGTVVVATHGPAAREFATRTVYLRNGLLTGAS